MIIRKATITDLSSITKIHIDAFKGYFLTSLGPQFLDFYYTCFIKSPETETFIAEENGIIIGFAASTKVCKGFNSRLIKRNLVSFGILSLRLLFMSPSTLLRLLKNLKKKGKSVEDNEYYAELYSIGVSSSAQRLGIGKKLLFHTEQALIDAGVDRLSLTTDYYDNDSAIRFYRSMGYETFYEFVTYPNRKMYRLIKKLNRSYK